jgi:hypothetical protein
MQQKTFDLNTLNGANGFSVPGVVASAYLGQSVSTAGDVNGDGLSDIVLGAYGANSGAGASYVIFGSRGGFVSSFNLNNLNGSNGFTVPGVIASGALGYSVSTAGDLNGDGISDLVLGAYTANSGNGTAYVIFGSREEFAFSFNLTNLNGTNGFAVPGVAANGYLGYSVSTAGDFNGDGVSDLVLGAFLANSYAGVSYVIFGSRGGFTSSFNLTSLNGINGFAVLGITPSDRLGYSASMAGDLNGDGLSDLVLGAYTANSAAGASYVIFGSRAEFAPSFNLTNLNGSNGFTVPGVVVNGYLGLSVSMAGDINGDGISDLILGASLANSDAGTSYVIFGSRGGFAPSFNLTNLNGTNGFTVPGVVEGGYLGGPVSTAGDLNGDGVSDLVLGSQGANSLAGAGASVVIFGSREGFASSFNLTNLNGSNGFTVPGVVVNGYLGQSVSTAGDINGDGISDLILGASLANSAGTSYVIFGKFPVVLLNNQMIITEGQTLLLTNVQLSAMDVNNPIANLNFTVSNLQGGRFELLSNPGTSIATFSQQQITNDQIRFASNRTAVVSYAVSVTNGQFTLPPTPANVTFTNHAPEVISTPATQLVEPNQPFQFSLQADQIFNDTDGDPLRYTATLSGGAVLPSWMRFDTTQPNQLIFSGTDPAPGGTVISLSALDPLNASGNTQFQLLVTPGGNGTSITNVNTTSQIAVPVAVAVGITSLAAAAFGFWRYFSNKKGREGHQLANYLRDSLKLKGLDNFYETENARKYVAAVQEFSNAFKLQGIDVDAMENHEIKGLADNIASAARNKITDATDCLGYSVITVSDLKNRMQAIVPEVQQLRSDYSGRPAVT